MTDALIAAARSMFDRSIAEMRAAIDGASPEVLNWRPAGEDTNSIAVLAVHSMHSTRSWLCVATGTPEPPRDRDAEFISSAEDAAALLSTVDTMTADCRDLLSTEAPMEWSQPRTTVRQHTSAPQPISAAWALLHALEHLREHVAHLQLTRQLWEARQV
jgi:uncharacterized damage-inducible protein DinB